MIQRGLQWPQLKSSAPFGTISYEAIRTIIRILWKASSLHYFKDLFHALRDDRVLGGEVVRGRAE